MKSIIKSVFTPRTAICSGIISLLCFVNTIIFDTMNMSLASILFAFITLFSVFFALIADELNKKDDIDDMEKNFQGSTTDMNFPSLILSTHVDLANTLAQEELFREIGE